MEVVQQSTTIRTHLSCYSLTTGVNKLHPPFPPPFPITLIPFKAETHVPLVTIPISKLRYTCQIYRYILHKKLLAGFIFIQSTQPKLILKNLFKISNASFAFGKHAKNSKSFKTFSCAKLRGMEIHVRVSSHHASTHRNRHKL